MKRFLLILAAVAALGLVFGPTGCGKDDKKDGDKKADKKDGDKKGADKKDGDKKDGDKKDGDKKDGDKKDGDKAAAGGELNTGIAECDDPFNKYMKCIVEKMPEGAGRDATIDGMKQATAAYGDMAKDEATKAALVDSCKAAADAYKTGAEALGCTW